jgi:hypothetical protein
MNTIKIIKRKTKNFNINPCYITYIHKNDHLNILYQSISFIFISNFHNFKI